MNIPISFLKCCLLFCAKYNIREQFTGIAINKGHIVAVDGYALLACKIDVPDDFSVIIPKDDVKFFLSKIDKKHQNSSCELTVENNSLARLDFGIERQYFVPIDEKFVNWKSVVNDDLEFLDCFPRFDWKYLENVKKVAKILNTNYIIKPTGLETKAVVKFDRDDVFGVVMPELWEFSGES